MSLNYLIDLGNIKPGKIIKKCKMGNQAKNIFTLPFRIIRFVLVFLFKGKVLRKTEGAKFSNSREYSQYLNSRNKGILLDGQDLCLTEKESYQNVCVIARVGAGKTTRYVVPNVLNRAKQNCSIVVNDPKGEVYELTSGILKDRGYNIIVIDPENIDRSSSFNPFMEAKDEIELEQIAEILVKSGNTDKSDSFWNNGAIRFVSVFMKCLKNAGSEDPAYFTLANLYYLFQNFGNDGSKLDDWMARYSINPDDNEDSRLWDEWKGVLTGNEEGVQSFVLNAITALKALSNQNIALLTSKSDFSLDRIRDEKTIIYFITPPQHAEYYSFLTSIFFRSVFNSCMRKMPTRKTLPVYVLYDEFGHSTIPNFVSTANTIRGYKVSLSIILQSIAQLNARYGRDYAYSIQGGFNTYLAYSGSDPESSLFFERIIGKQRITQLPNNMQHFVESYREQNLMNSNEVRTMDSNQVLIVTTNKNPILIESLPFFEVRKYKKMTLRGVHKVTSTVTNKIKHIKL
jgi:type IV secretion system protein VirD4